jgi:hypothetical protein
MDWLKMTLPPSTSEIPHPAAIAVDFQAIYQRPKRPKDFFDLPG